MTLLIQVDMPFINISNNEIYKPAKKMMKIVKIHIKIRLLIYFELYIKGIIL